VEDGPERVEVGRRPRGRAGEGLGGHVERGPDGAALLGEAEVGVGVRGVEGDAEADEAGGPVRPEDPARGHTT